MREIPFTLDDLPQFSFPKVGLAVLGHPIGHSISPILHNAALTLLAERDPVFTNWSYERLDVIPEDLPDALNRLSAAGFLGVNLTIPHKVEVLELLEDLDSNAKIMGAVNTLILRGQKWYGYNTDGYGLEVALESVLGCKFKDSQVLILGAGGLPVQLQSRLYFQEPAKCMFITDLLAVLINCSIYCIENSVLQGLLEAQ